MSDRAAIGLEEGSITRVLPHVLSDVSRGLLHLTPNQLASVVEGLSSTHNERQAAGFLLGLVGDPRINLNSPAMCDVPEGACIIGTKEQDVDELYRRWSDVGVVREWLLKECPQHTVRVEAFRLGKYAVTNYEYMCFVLDTPSAELPSSWQFGIYPHHLSNHPVWAVSESAADAYVRWLSAKTARNFRLPTENEWEYAASGGDGRDFPWGEIFDSDMCNTAEGGPLQTSPIGSYPQGRAPFGNLDMAGNVEEYVATDYLRYPGGVSVSDDLSPEGSSYRVARGGSFTRFGDLARCSRRHGRYSRAFYAMGFRLAESV